MSKKIRIIYYEKHHHLEDMYTITDIEEIDNPTIDDKDFIKRIFKGINSDQDIKICCVK